MFKKIGNFFKFIWANKNSILAIITSVAAIGLAVFIVLKGFVLDQSWLKFMYNPEVAEVIAVEGVQAINVGDVLVAEIPAVLAEDGVTVISEMIPAVLATEADVVIGVEAVEGVAYQAACLNIWGYIILSVIACGFCVLDIYGIVNHYGIESVEKFAERIAERKAVVEEKLVTKEQKAEYKEKLSIFNKGLKEVHKKISGLEGKIGQLKTLIDNGLATTEQIVNYNSLSNEISNLQALESNYNSKIEEIKQVM